MSDDALPLCACEQYYESHHPECPARRAHEAALLRLGSSPCKRMMVQEHPYADCFPAENCLGCDCWRANALPVETSPTHTNPVVSGERADQHTQDALPVERRKLDRYRSALERIIEAWDGDSESMHNDPAVIAREALSDE